MARGDKSEYTDKQKRKAEHIAEGYVDRGVPEKEAKSRAWATVNKESGGGEKSGSGRGKSESHASSQKGGKKRGGILVVPDRRGTVRLREEGGRDPQAKRRGEGEVTRPAFGSL